MGDPDRHALMTMTVVITVAIMVVIMNADADPARPYADRNALRASRHAQSNAGSRGEDSQSNCTQGLASCPVRRANEDYAT